MLIELHIRNLAIIEGVSLPLVDGFNVLTGETGAGKSIIVGALSFLLGERATPDLIRTGADRATVEGVFDIAGRPDVAALLDERGAESDGDTTILRREIALTGRTRAWVNGTATTAGTLAGVGRRLVDLHGQHEAQALLDAEAQRRLLDEFSGAASAAAAVRESHAALEQVDREITSLAARRAEVERRADYLRFVAREIEDAKLVAGEEVALEDEARRLEHAAELRQLATGAAAALEAEDGGVLQELSPLQRTLATLIRIDPSLARLQELYDGGYYALDTLSRELADYARRVELDPARLEEVQQRRDLLYRLTKKYGHTAADVIAAGAHAREELELVDSAELDLRSLERRRADARAELEHAAAMLTTARADAAGRLARAVTAMLPELGLPDGTFAVALRPRAEIAATGAEDVEFRVAFNVGHDARPLARVASGGELSRLMLALKTVIARLDRIPTLVFDEVDAGIGGRVALQVGELLRQVAGHHQVLVVTHLAQIAARAHHHVVVTKGAAAGLTSADTSVVAGGERITEIARMLGGDADSAVSRAHAAQLLQVAAEDAPPARRRKVARGR